ncbi:uncharacterized protein DEA37_0005564 [Paragonimus westermani]|uniref:Reverse transcriptase/retrotransposon-derived protein RNase H-like domain-containing protein n=1 Tax=Paragonimus westermani TaxID=34504 RepID=A0A5J4N8G2_9TREM|nr:uncharacterized protein DEA37_0005564 [Paragonimus westermani]
MAECSQRLKRVAFTTLSSAFTPLTAYGVPHPLPRLTEKDKKFVWSSECHAALSTVKDKLGSSSILEFLYSSPSAGLFTPNTDASDLTIGAVLS